VDNLLEGILLKIENKTVTVADFNNLLQETAPESARDRVRRRTIANPTDSHIDNATGHQQLELPTFGDRLAPRRKPVKQQNHGRSAVGRTHSQRTQARSRLAEAVKYVTVNMGKPITEDWKKLDKEDILAVTHRLMHKPGVDSTWLRNLMRMVE